MTKPLNWVLDVQENEEGELFIQLTDEILEGSGFKIGDDLDWIDNKDGSFTLKKRDTVWVKVDCINQFRTTYMVETPIDHPEYALDDVVMGTCKEFSQEFIGETIVTHRTINTDEALVICDKENDYTKSWSEEQKLKAFFTKTGESRDDYKV